MLAPEEIGEHAPQGVFTLITGVAPDSAIELWELPTGQLVVVSYSTFTALAASCGAGQPFRHMAPSEVVEVCAEAHAQALLDELLPVAPRYPKLDPREQPDLPMLDDAAVEGEHVYIPSRRTKRGDRVVGVELQPYKGKTTLLAYTTPQALTKGCGPYQPYVVVPRDFLETIMLESGAEQVLFNATLSEEARYSRPVLDWSSRSTMGGEWNF
ncbi:SAV_915 family protein [Prauserella rugosa]|uniref:SAV_915 family protein n=1 Tax=Prauserella rugosa TaxID=43354 RepID=UPI000ADE6545|nr:SAV_915 family protein [Prauserella rugosa]